MAKKPTTGTGFGDTETNANIDPIIGQSIDPAIAASGNDNGDSGSDEPVKRKRGRPAGTTTGTKTNTKKNNLSNSVDNLSKTLMLLHLGIASKFNVPEIVIDERESELLSSAAMNMLDQFEIQIDPKMQAAVGLIVAAGTVYGPRVIAISYRRNKEQKEKQNETDLNVVNFNG